MKKIRLSIYVYINVGIYKISSIKEINQLSMEQQINTLKEELHAQMNNTLKIQKKQLEEFVRQQVKSQLITFQNLKIQDGFLEDMKKETLGQEQGKIMRALEELKDLKDQVRQIEPILKSIEKVTSSKEINYILQEERIREAGINPNSLSMSRFRVNDTVEFLKPEKTDDGKLWKWFQLLGNVSVKEKAQTSFTLNSSNDVCMGIVDSKFVKDENSWNQKEWRYVKAEGSWKGQQKPSRQGETVIMTITQQVITWSVDGLVRVEYVSQMLAKDSHSFVPCIWVIRKGTKLKWL